MFDGTLKDAFKARTAAAGADDGFDLDGGLVVSQDGNGNMAAGFSIDGRTDFGSVSVSPSGPGQRVGLEPERLVCLCRCCCFFFLGGGLGLTVSGVANF